MESDGVVMQEQDGKPVDCLATNSTTYLAFQFLYTFLEFLILVLFISQDDVFLCNLLICDIKLALDCVQISL